MANGRGDQAAAHLKTAALWEGNPTVCDKELGEGHERILVDDAPPSGAYSRGRRKSEVFVQRVRSLSIKPIDGCIEDVGPKYTLFDIRRSGKLVLYTAIMCLLW